MAEDKQNVPNVINLLLDENKQKQLLAEDEEENFLDECKFLVHVTVCLQYRGLINLVNNILIN